VDPTPKGINVEILHAYDTLTGLYSGANPKTTVRRKGQDTDYMTFDGTAIKLSIKVCNLVAYHLYIIFLR
jgi:UDP-glucose 4-epimerase